MAADPDACSRSTATHGTHRQHQTRAVEQREPDRPQAARAKRDTPSTAPARATTVSRDPPGQQHRHDQPAGDVLQRVGFEDPGRTAESEHVGRPAEENSSRAEWRADPCLDRSSDRAAADRARAARRTGRRSSRERDIDSAERPGGPEARTRSGRWKPDQRGEAGTAMIESRDRRKEQHHQHDRNESARPFHRGRDLMRGLPSRREDSGRGRQLASRVRCRRQAAADRFRDRDSRNRRHLASLDRRSRPEPAHDSAPAAAARRAACVCCVAASPVPDGVPAAPVRLRVGVSDDRIYERLTDVDLSPRDSRGGSSMRTDLSAYAGWKWSLFYHPDRVMWRRRARRRRDRRRSRSRAVGISGDCHRPSRREGVSARRHDSGDRWIFRLEPEARERRGFRL